MPVAAGVVRDLRIAARRVLAACDMPAERRRATALDRTHHLQLLEAHMPAVGLAPSRTVIAENVRELQSWSSHGRRRYGAGGSGSSASRLARLRRGALGPSRGTLDLGNHSGRHAGVAGRRLELHVSEQYLNQPNIRAALKQMSRKAMAKRMERERLAQPRGFRGLLE